MQRSRFGRSEKLKSRKAIQSLFTEGSSLKAYPLALRFLAEAHGSKEPRVAFSVAKRRHPRAVDRNRIKRQLREAYRLTKAESPGAWAGYDLLWIYLPQEMPQYSQLVKAMQRALERLHESSPKCEAPEN